VRHVSLLIFAVLLLAACGSDGDEAAPPRPPPPPPTATDTETETTGGDVTTEPTAGVTPVVVYFLFHGRVQPVRRQVPETRSVGAAALGQLVAGPTDPEREIGLTTEVAPTTVVERIAIANGVATVDLRPCPPLAQVVFTLTRFPTVQSVAGNCTNGRRLARGDFEDDSPAILVESPLLGDEVHSPMRIQGSANTFEATFMVDVVDRDARIVASDFVTATSGSGTRGTFDATIPFEVQRPGGALIVYEKSAKDASQINVVEIPLELQP
jgi:germination protein M